MGSAARYGFGDFFARVQRILRKRSLPMNARWSFSALFVACLLLDPSAPSQAQNKVEGKKLYETYCVTCHGDKGKGNGPAAQSLPVKPADHTNGTVMNPLSDQFLFDIISKGGGAVGKSTFMPAWGSALNEKQIKDIVAHLRSIAEPPYKAENNGKPAGK
jgi:mono/diheme cytochrome c family protein